ncbi:CvpA family protein [Kushneria phosphatilytica]|uniref:CvpA family protein n=1 Tax=Kushneria phosphatilytica TaxID=657387 RepID=A0A5C1A1M4_9GAMM|nr:CvpA family protein [Kushneria phosphatilytica]QEL10805.1 CvpA family protein [Kushneria phosphatilytica]
MIWTWVDGVIAAILLMSTLSGVMRGFIRAALGMAAWVAALIAATRYAGRAGELLRDYVTNSDIRLAIGFVLVVLVVVVTAGIVIRLLHALIEWVGMGAFNRLLGALFGLLRGGAIVILLMAVAALSPVQLTAAWQQSVLLPVVLDLRDAALARFAPDTGDRYRQRALDLLEQGGAPLTRPMPERALPPSAESQGTRLQ